MNIEEFEVWLKKQFKSGEGKITALPRPIASPYWAKVVYDISPHYYGYLPDSIKKAFPNETSHQYQYRKAIHESMTKDQLWQAIDDVKRLIMSDKFAIEAEVGMREEITKKEYGDKKNQNFESFVFNSVYPRRVLDPNALLGCVAKPNPDDLSMPVDIKLRIFPSADIKVFKKFLVVVYDRMLSAKTGMESYRVFTKTHQLLHIQVENNRWVTEEVYMHDSGHLCIGPLGGKEITQFDRDSQQEVTYFEGDFSYAVNKMNTLERKNNQLEAATLRVVFPHMVTQGLKCETCDGSGEVPVRDEETGGITKPHHHYPHNYRKAKGQGQDLLIPSYSDDDDPNDFLEQGVVNDNLYQPMTKCTSCKGTGTIAISVLDNITITPPNNDIFDNEGNLRITGGIAEKVIGFASPDISSVKELREQTNDAQIKVSEALNITKPSKFAESGVSKEKDRDGKKTKLQDISDGLTTLSMQTLSGMASLKFLNSTQRENEKEAIKIIQPQDFEIKPIEELEEEYFANLENKPLVLRRKQFKELLLKRFKNDDVVSVLDDLAFMYTAGLHLMTQKELGEMEMKGLITRADAIKALRIHPILEMLLKMGLIDINMPPQGDQLNNLIDPFVQPLIDSVNNANAVQAGFDDSALEELEEEGTQQEDT